MDEQQFDNHIKGKLADIAPELDYEALADFRSLMDQEQKPAGWKNWLRRLIWPVILLLLISNGISLWGWMQTSGNYASLRAELEELQAHKAVPPLTDTVYIAGKRDTIYINQPAPTNSIYHTTLVSGRTKKGSMPSLATSYSGMETLDYFTSKNAASHPTATPSGLNSSNPTTFGSSSTKTQESTFISALNPDLIYQQRMIPNLATRNWNDPGNLSDKEKRQLDRQAKKDAKIKTPFGLMAGGDLLLFNTFPEYGTGLISSGAGVVTELIFARHWRFHTGLEFTRPRYDIAVGDMPPPQFPVLDPAPETIQQIMYRTNNLEIPLQFKYFFGNGKRGQFFAGAGWQISKVWYQYLGYVHEENGSEYIEPRESQQWRKADHFAQILGGYEYTPGTLLRLQVSGYYSYGLSKYGPEGFQMNMTGIRATCLFNLK